MEAGNEKGDGKRISFVEILKKERTRVGRPTIKSYSVTIERPKENSQFTSSEVKNDTEERKEDDETAEITVDAE